MNICYKGYGFVMERKDLDFWEDQGISTNGMNYHKESVFFGVLLEKINLKDSPYIFTTPKDYTEGSQKYAQFLDETKNRIKSDEGAEESVRLDWLNYLVQQHPRVVFLASESPELFNEKVS